MIVVLQSALFVPTWFLSRFISVVYPDARTHALRGRDYNLGELSSIEKYQLIFGEMWLILISLACLILFQVALFLVVLRNLWVAAQWTGREISDKSNIDN